MVAHDFLVAQAKSLQQLLRSEVIAQGSQHFRPGFDVIRHGIDQRAVHVPQHRSQLIIRRLHVQSLHKIVAGARSPWPDAGWSQWQNISFSLQATSVRAKPVSRSGWPRDWTGTPAMNR